MSHNNFYGRALPLSKWPEPDRLAWIDAQAEDDDLLGIRRPAARWRASTKELHSRCYGIWLAWLHSQNLLHAHEAPADRVTKARLAAYLQAEHASGNTARTLINHAVGLRHMFEALTPERDWTWMLPMIGKLKTAVTPTRNHSDLPSIRQLFELGLALTQRAECEGTGTLKQRAIVFRNGLAIAMLAARPLMRRANLASIKIGEHLSREGATYRLQFSDEEMKGRRKRGGLLPQMLTAPIERYIDLYRPALLGSKPDPDGVQFISALGRPICPHALSHEIGKVTDAVFGRRITTHEFRHAAVSSIAKEDPAHVGIVPSVLGHADYRTSEAYYVFADEHAAFQRLDRAVEALISGKHDMDHEA